jgi:hypothetical protein
MAVVLMSLIGATMQFYARNMNVRDMDVRRVQLAAAVLQMLADDLRAAVHSEPFDASVLESFLAAAAGQAISQAIDPAASEVLGLDSDMLGSAVLEEPSLPPEAMDLQTSMLTLQRPGLIGNQFELQFDISRLPRLEQWQQTLGATAGEVVDVPSDLKTVTYYVQDPGNLSGVPDELQSYLPVQTLAVGEAAPGGLVRRQLDRAANKWAIESTGTGSLLSTGELVAAEIAGLEFSYFDGLQWQPFWNSDQRQTLPVAIEIKLTMAPLSSDGESTLATDSTARVFTQIIALPAGRPAPLDTMSTGGVL